MKAKLVMVILLLTLAIVCGKKEDEKKSEKKDKVEIEEEDDEDEGSSEMDDESYDEENEHMTFCLNQENVTESQMRNFLMSKTNEDKNEPLKKAILCFLKKMNFFDGETWNLKVINETIEENSKLLKIIKECLKKDDKTLPPHERTYQAQKCIIETRKQNAKEKQKKTQQKG